MMNPLTMLVVEDRPNHMTDLNAMLEAELPRIPVQVKVLYAQDLETALQLLPQADIVMTDVFFPAGPGEPEQPNGQIVVERCLAEQKPVVWVTSTHHHGRSTNDVSQWGRKHGLEMFDCYVDDDCEAPHKPWKEGFYGLLYLTLCVEVGHCVFLDGKMMGPEVDWTGTPQRYPFGKSAHIAYELFSDKEIDTGYYPLARKMVEMGFPRS